MDRKIAYLAGFVLCNFVLGVFLAILALTVCAASLWYVDLVIDTQLAHESRSRLEFATRIWSPKISCGGQCSLYSAQEQLDAEASVPDHTFEVS